MVGRKATVLLFALIIVLSQVPKLQCAASIGEDGQADLKSINVQHPQRNLLQAIDCGSACGKRCSKSGLVKRCIYFCNVCCQKCQCVPPGTYGNKESCPCYASLKNSKGKDKCP